MSQWSSGKETRLQTQRSVTVSREGEYVLALKKIVGRDRRLNVVILECFFCRLERVEVGKVGG